MIPVMWFIVAIVMTPAGPVKVMSNPMPSKETCMTEKARGDELVAKEGHLFESKCVMFGGVQS